MNQEFEFLMYRAADEDISVNAVVKDETIWLTQSAMAELFSVNKSSISRHLKNIFAEGELDEKVVVAKIATTTQHGALTGKTQTRDTQFYNLDATISVGYRVNSRRTTSEENVEKRRWYRISRLNKLIWPLCMYRVTYKEIVTQKQIL